MTHNEILSRWDSLSPAERDAWVAEAVMGWKPSSSDFDQWVTPDGERRGDPVAYPWSPSAELEATWEMESSLEGRPDIVITRYVHALMDLTAYRNGQGLHWLWRLIHATPSQRCRAALLTVEGE